MIPRFGDIIITYIDAQRLEHDPFQSASAVRTNTNFEQGRIGYIKGGKRDVLGGNYQGIIEAYGGVQVKNHLESYGACLRNKYGNS